MGDLNEDGFACFDASADGALWAKAARRAAQTQMARPDVRARNLRHGQTWAVGLDLLANAPDGSVGGVPLGGTWRGHVPDLPLHPGQVSIVYPGYPGRDANETEASQRYRAKRGAAHVDGLLPIGPARRRFATEYHAYVLGLPLTPGPEAPTVVWKGSHRIMQAALRDAIGSHPVADVDITDAYQAARRTVFERCIPVQMCVPVGGAFLLHRFALHGTAPWEGPVAPARMVAFFRPAFEDPAHWLGGDAVSASETDRKPTRFPA